MSVSVAEFLGVAGVSPNENAGARRIGSVLNIFVFAALTFLVIDFAFFYSHHPLDVPHLNTAVWFIFVIEFVVNLLVVDDRKRYLKNNWLNLFIILVAFPWSQWLDSEWALIIRSLRLLLLIRFFTSFFRTARRLLSKNRFGQVLIGFAFLVVGAGGVFSYIEQRPFIDGIWYALVTITTVGYGDVVPFTEPGRIFGSILIFFGVLFFSLVTANFAAFLIGTEQRKLEHDILSTVNQIEKHLALQNNETEKNTEKLIHSLIVEIDVLKREIDLLKKDKLDL